MHFLEFDVEIIIVEKYLSGVMTQKRWNYYSYEGKIAMKKSNKNELGYIEKELK